MRRSSLVCMEEVCLESECEDIVCKIGLRDRHYHLGSRLLRGMMCKWSGIAVVAVRQDSAMRMGSLSDTDGISKSKLAWHSAQVSSLI